ncbi:MAG: hypothetical protein RJA36_3969 [Pseudomonadota bacterium]
MSTTAADYIARIWQARESWCDLAPGKRVKVRRPGELAMRQLAGGGATLEKLCSCVVAWDGITEGDLFDGGSENYVPFDAGVWAEAVADQAEWAALVAAHVTQLITEHMAKREATRGNSQPS